MKKLKKSAAELMVWHGMRLLKEEAPHVLKDLNLDKLDLADGRVCVLGQGYHGYYQAGKQALGLSGTEAKMFGFDAESGEHNQEDYSLLTETWIEAVKKDRVENPFFYLKVVQGYN